jgi:hypothetical protein
MTRTHMSGGSALGFLLGITSLGSGYSVALLTTAGEDSPYDAPDCAGVLARAKSCGLWFR